MAPTVYGTYIIERLLSSHSLLLYIPHRDDRNQVNGFVTKNNMTFKIKHAKVLVQSSINQETACRNGKICIKDDFKYDYSRRICYLYLIPVYVSQSEINKIICLLTTGLYFEYHIAVCYL